MKAFNLQFFGGGGGASGGDGFEEVTHPAARSKGHREYKNSKTGQKYRYDPPRGKDPEHWHVENPNKTGNDNMYLDRYGKPSPRHDPRSALNRKDFRKLLEKLKRGKK